MPKDKDSTNHPCHLLSLPQAKRFWCRHCMTVFEDAITRWRHSRSCRYGVVNNFMRRRELEAKALQNTTALSPVEARLGQSIQMSDLAGTTSHPAGMIAQEEPDANPDLQSTHDAFTCFICHMQFGSMEAMRHHVKYPCSASKIITSRVPHPKHSIPVFIDTLPAQHRSWQPNTSETQSIMLPKHTPQSTNNQINTVAPTIQIQTQFNENNSQIANAVANSESAVAGQSVENITPTNIYVNDQGETVIEVENLDLNTEGGELSLAHLLTQLSQQGIVFDKTKSGQLQARQETGDSSSQLYTGDQRYEITAVSDGIIKEEEEQPTAEDAANTLAQLAGFRNFRSSSISGSAPYHLSTEVQGQSEENYLKQELQDTYSVDVNSIQSHEDIQYEYSTSEYAVESQSVDHSSHLQTVVEHGSQSYEEIKVDNSEGTYYNVTYINPSDTDGQSQIEVSSNEINMQMDHNMEGNEILVQQHSHHEVSEHLDSSVAVNMVNGSNITTCASSEESTTVNASTSNMTEYQISDVRSEENMDHVIHVTVGNQEHAHESYEHSAGEVGRDEENGDEFAIQTVSLQEIVDSESSPLTYGEQKLPTKPFHQRTIVSSSELQSAEPGQVIMDGASSIEGLQIESEGHNVPLQEIGSSVQLEGQNHQTMFVVTSTGIQPVGL